MNRRPLRPRCAATGTHRSPAAASGAPWHCAHLLRRALLTLRLFAGFGGILLTSHCASDAAGRGSGNRDPLVALSRVEITRTMEPRLSIPTAYRPCLAAVPTGGTVPRADCKVAREDLAPSSDVLDVAQRASVRIQANADPDALHAAALIDLIWGEGGIPLERSVSYLRTASRLASRESGVYADLAAALLVRAERHQAPRDLVEAIEMADVALELEPRNEAARFNLALGLERVGLDGQAQRAWEAFLQVDSTSSWAEEARRRARAPVEAPEPPTAPQVGAKESDLAAYVEAAPEAAMFFGWDHLLDSWGAAVISGDPKGADGLLRHAAAIGAELERRNHDATLAEAVGAIRAAASRPTAIGALATAHHHYAAGRAAYRKNDVVAAGRLFKRVLVTPGISAPLAGWARFHYAATLVYQGRLDAAEVELRRVVAHADTVREPALAARGRWGLGTSLLRRGRYQQSIQALEAAAALFERAGERENLGSVQNIAADAKQVFAGAAAEYEARQRALITLRPYRRSIGLHNVFIGAALSAAADGFLRTALRIQDEGVEVADRIGDEIHPAEARIARAKLLTAAGRREAVAEDLRAARAMVERLEPGPPRNWFKADLQSAEAATMPSGPQAAAALDSAAAFWRSQGNELRLVPALAASSDAALAAGDVELGATQLDRALALVDQQSASMTTAELRASLLDATQRVVDRLVMLRVGAGAPKKALADLERARVSLAPIRARSTATSGSRLATAPGQVAAEYALIADTLLIWTVADTAVRLTRTTLDRGRLVQTIERTRAALELRADVTGLEQDLAALYDWLLRPVEGALGTDGTPVVLIADGEIAAVPFAALRDTAQRRYLIEEHPLRFVSSVRDAVRQPSGPLTKPKVLLVADPTFDQTAFPGLVRLPGAVAETKAIAGGYADTVLLSGSNATATALESTLVRANILHYAGHAVFNDERPEQSLLVLAPDSGEATPGRETAAAIARLDLTRLRLVVLSACETNRSRAGRSGGFAGLAGAFLAAGGGGVVGSLWRVDDDLTRRLMTEFHRAYRSTANGAEALRAAQLQLLHSAEPAVNSPAAWAAFRYAGS
jgi:CHAT domain-containing protein